MRGLGAFSGDSRKYAMIRWGRGKIAVFVMLCGSLLALGRAVAVEGPTPETCDAECSLGLAQALAMAYDQNNLRGIEYLHNFFDEKIEHLVRVG